MTKHYLIFGATGAIGKGFTDLLEAQGDVTQLSIFSRSLPSAMSDKTKHYKCDVSEESSIAAAYQAFLRDNDQPAIDGILVAIGILHDEARGIAPEKALKELTQEKLESIFRVNAMGPALIAKYFCPLLPRDKPSFFAALSARVGSISDNHLGGWYAYRASKAALNMLIKTTAIEMARTHKQAVIVGLHPGTVDSNLSKPFQAHVKEGHLFTPEYAVSSLWETLQGLEAKDSGKCFAYDGQEIEP